MGLVSAVLGVGGGVGIVASGLIVDNLSWRWLFVVAAAVVAVALVLVWRFVPESSVRAPSKVDAWGALLLSGALVALLVGLTEGQDLGWGSPAIVGLFAASVVLFVVWGLVELRVDEPDGGHAHAGAPHRAVHQPDGHALGLRPLHDLGDPPDLLPAAERPAGRPHGRRRLRLRHLGHGGGPLDAADLPVDPVRRAVRGRGRARYGQRGPLVAGMVLVGDRIRRHRDVPRRAVAAGPVVHPLRRRHRLRLRRDAEADRRRRPAHRDRRSRPA